MFLGLWPLPCITSTSCFHFHTASVPGIFCLPINKDRVITLDSPGKSYLQNLELIISAITSCVKAFVLAFFLARNVFSPDILMVRTLTSLKVLFK